MFGYDWIVVGGAEPFYERSFHLATPSQQGWAMGSALVGCLLAAVVAGGSSDKFGRKRLDPCRGRVCGVVRRNRHGRHLVRVQPVANCRRGGHWIGLEPLADDIAELAPAAVRGKLVWLNELTIVLGVSLAQSANYAIAQHGMRCGSGTPWRRTSAARHGPGRQGGGPRIGVADAAGSCAATVERFVQLADRRNCPLEEEAVAQIVAEMNRRLGTATNISRWILWPSNWPAGSWFPGTSPRAGRGCSRLRPCRALVFFTLMFFVPESPRWLAKNGKPDRACAILTRIGGAAHADRELAGIEETLGVKSSG